jgi:hypothetical protein
MHDEQHMNSESAKWSEEVQQITMLSDMFGRMTWQRIDFDDKLRLFFFLSDETFNTSNPNFLLWFPHYIFFFVVVVFCCILLYFVVFCLFFSFSKSINKEILILNRSIENSPYYSSEIQQQKMMEESNKVKKTQKCI